MRLIMNNQDLMYFCKLIETGSYTKTAAFFNVTQPTISAAVKRLAKHFKDPLVEQTNRKGKLNTTVAGDLLYNKSVKLLHEINSVDYDVMHASEKRYEFLSPALLVVFTSPKLSPSFIKPT